MKRRDFLRACGMTLVIDEAMAADEIHFVHPDGRVDRLVNVGKSAKPRLADIKCCMTCARFTCWEAIGPLGRREIIPTGWCDLQRPLQDERVMEFNRHAFQVCDYYERSTES